MQKLNDPRYLSFPFRIVRNPDGEDENGTITGGPATSGRQAHVREQIEQVLFTNPKERVFRPEFGAGVKQLIFEPNTSVLRETIRQRLLSSLSDALLGEVDPRTLSIQFESEDEKLFILVEYQLATIQKNESHRFDVSGET